MDHHTIITTVVFAGFFLTLITFLQRLSEKITFPYTVALLLVGFIAQFLVHTFHLPVHVSLSPDIIFFILLPILLFEAAMHINLHQFRLQFKTISFLATFGLLVSMFFIGFAITYLLGMPFMVALLFGALISATDPIAVLALFKTLGAPKRLALLADGESMFNDATGVIAFRIVSAFVLTGTAFQTGDLIKGFGDFSYVFFGSLIYGTVLGYLASRLMPLFSSDRILVNTLTAALALGSFITAEHYLHVSGVITTVMAGITLGNVGRNKISVQVIHFIEEFWAFLGFLAVSLVFFFASYNLHVGVFFGNLGNIAIVVLLVLIARSVSVYLTSFLSNTLPFFKDEPNIPLSWQHILNWGGLRGVIPLVLVYSLPEDFAYREEFLGFTLATLVFTLIVNGLTIKWLLQKLKLHIPHKAEVIIDNEMKLFDLESRKAKLKHLSKREFDDDVIDIVDRQLEEGIISLRNKLVKDVKPDDFLQSLKLQALEIERKTFDKLFHQGRFNENVYYYFISELDLQLDALEHPSVFKVRTIKEGGFIDTNRSYRKRLVRVQRFLVRYPFASKLLGLTEEDIVADRYELLQARLLSSYAVLDYLDTVEKIFTKKEYKNAIAEVRDLQLRYLDKNSKEIDKITKETPIVNERYQKRIIRALIKNGSSVTPAH